MTDPTGTAPAARWSGSMHRPRLTIRTRLVGSVAVLSALGLLGAGAAALLVESGRIEAKVRASLAQEIGEFSELAGSGIDPQSGRPFEDAESLVTLSMRRNIPDRNETHLGFLADVTIVQVDGAGGLDQETSFRRQVSQAVEPGYGEFDAAGQGRVIYAVMPFVKQGQRNHFVVAHFIDRELADLGHTIRSYAVAATVAWVVLVMAAWLAARRILHPIHALRRTASAISESDVSGRITVQGHDEVADLGRTVNGMLDRLDDALHAQRRMLDDAGHELRTPITVIRGHLELMDDTDPNDVRETRDLAIDELDRMGRMVEDLLVLAKARRPDFLHREYLNLADIIHTTFDKAQALGTRDWALDLVVAQPVLADRERLTQALLQLAANAVSVTGPQDTIAFGCSATATGARIWVRDTGPGVPPAERLTIFERFRTGVDGGGTGLGLAIVAAIARAHGGAARVTTAGPAGGAMFLLDIPAGGLPDAAPTDDVDRVAPPGGSAESSQAARRVPASGVPG